MQNQIEKLYQISQKKERIILGLMSGTSLDGLDLALCKFTESSTNTKFELLHFTTVLYDDDFKNELNRIFCKEVVNLQHVCLMNNYVAKIHSKIINETLLKWNINKEEIDCIASHGQTIYHAPLQKHQLQKFGNATLQIGDGDIIATATGVITISDFRQKHIATGGNGAPLALYGDYFLLSCPIENRLLLNIGGISNFTFLPKSKNFDEVICTDCGPGNTLMDAYTLEHFNLPFDDDGEIAAQGKVIDVLIDWLLLNNFFKHKLPISTGQETFGNSLLQELKKFATQQNLTPTDIVATLNFFTAKCIAIAIEKLIQKIDFNIYVSGGGWHNKTLVYNLQSLLSNNKILSTEILGMNANAKEAILFALLANETLAGETNFYNQSSTKNPLITMGKVCLPK